jgi:putative PIG3 family NAD(P)H quinone oxidoreductase
VNAVYIKEFGGHENLEIREVPDPPKPADSQVLVQVAAAGLNRADLLQCRGLYPPPPGYSPNIPGLEFAGEIIEKGSGVASFDIGDRVFGIAAGEAQAEQILIEASHVAHVPDSVSLIDAAAIPEAFVTAYDAIFTQGALADGESLLIHAVGSGVGLAALQIAKARGGKVYGTSRISAKLDRCREFGLDAGIATGNDDKFADRVLELTDGRGVDVVLDLVGGSYFEENLKSLAVKARLMLVGLTGGSVSQFDLGTALRKRLKITGTVLRARSVEEKAAAIREFSQNVVPLLASQIVRPNIDRVFSMTNVREAYEYLGSNTSFGKVVLKWN